MCLCVCVCVSVQVRATSDATVLKQEHNPSFSPIRPQQRRDITISPLLQQGQMNPCNSPNHTHTLSRRLNHCTLIMQTSLRIHCCSERSAAWSSFVSAECLWHGKQKVRPRDGRDFRQAASSLIVVLAVCFVSCRCRKHSLNK